MNKTISQLIIFLLLLLSERVVYSQQNPSGIKWKSINTGTYEIIFPEEITPLGQRVANLMVHYEKYNYSSIKSKPRHIPIVLINQYAEPNGFVSPAPFYSHWFTTPSSFDSVEWFKGLAIHEGRHMVQMNKLTEGYGKTAWQALLGDMGSALFSAIYVPVWFMEGDAVVMETALTKGGRGRTPYFNIWQRGLELSDEPRYSYYKSYLGSYDGLVPYADHYRLGYILSSYIRKHYGKDVWDRVLSDTGRYFLWFTFDKALTRATRRSITELYKSALDEYKLLWEKQIEGMKFTEAEPVFPHENNFKLPSVSMDYKYWYFIPYPLFSASTAKWESYLFPSLSGDGDLTAVQFTGDKKFSLVKLQNNSKIINICQIPGEVVSGLLMNERSFSTGGDFALWREGVPDPRWGYRSYSDLKILNIRTGDLRYLTERKKYTASTLSNDGKTAAGIEYGPDLKYRLSVINTRTGEEIFNKEINNSGHLFDPAISPDGKEIALAALADNGNAILICNLETGQLRNVTGYTHDERFKSPAFYGKYLLYGSDYSGIDNIYAVDLNSNKRFQVTSRPLGAYFPAVSGDRLFFNDYSVNGYKASVMKIDPGKWIPVDKSIKRVINYIAPIADQELTGDNNEIDNIPEKEYTVNNYYPVFNSINFFGWIPYFDSTSSEFYFSILSKDVLHTTDLTFSYIHNFNEKTDAGRASIAYSGFYPVITLNGGYGERALYLQDESTEKIPVYLTWDEITAYGAVTFPLNFSRGIKSRYLNLGTGSGYIKVKEKNRNDYSIYNGIVNDGDLQYINYTLSYRCMNQGAMNSVSPGTGGIFNLSYVHTPYHGDYRGSLFSSELSLYLPGITELQGLKFSGSYEKNGSSNYTFPRQYLFPRGYQSVTHEQFFKGTVDYSFPILNFSAHLWKLLYFKRINGALFYDAGAGNDSGYTAVKEKREFIYYRSAGYEITAEQNWLSNKYLAIELGLRYSRCFDADEDATVNRDKNRYDLVVRTPI